MLGAVGLWTVTGSMLSLWFAALAPLLAIASFGDQELSTRRTRRRDDAAAETALMTLAERIRDRHAAERRRAWQRFPDLARLIADPGEMWRLLPERQGRVLLGTGDVPLAVADPLLPADEVPDAARAAAREARAAAQTLTGAPIDVPLRGWIELLGPPTLVRGMARAMVLHLCLLHPPGVVEIAGDIPDDFDWIETLPHRHTAGRVRVGVTSAGQHAAGAGELDAVVALSGGAASGGAVRIRIGDSARGEAADSPPDPGESSPGRDGPHTRDDPAPWARVDTGEVHAPFRPQMLSHTQAAAIARALRARVDTDGGDPDGSRLAEALTTVPGPADGGVRDSLAAVIGLAGTTPAVVDLVSDGPHALVAGTTGSGKSELLRTWVVGIAARFTPRQVVFVLADFKGGTAFASLERLPHVVGVLTDLDATEAARGLESLRAEVRRRERILASVGARDIADGGTELARLVVVVDEFAALLAAHPDLAALFVDLAARGRALGIHLVLGTQRAAGVFREALLANCALRISLRAADSADSTLMIGDDGAARLPAGARGLGVAFLRRAGDSRPVLVRVGRVDEEFVARIAAATGGDEDTPVSVPWLPPLPRTVATPGRGEDAGDVLLGLADEPEQQRQRPFTLPGATRGLCVVGAPGAGVSTALRTIAPQLSTVPRWIEPSDLERAWDDLEQAAAGGGGALVIDGVDEIIARLPADYAAAALGMLESIARGAGEGSPLLLGAERLGGALSRVADLLPHRLLLRHTHRGDYLTHGGHPAHHDPDAPPGRGRIGGTLLQVYLPSSEPSAVRTSPVETWMPGAGETAWVARATPSVHDVRTRWLERGVVLRPVDEDAAVLDESEHAQGVVVCGDPEQWQRAWTRLTAMRGRGALLIDPSCAAEYRAFTGRRELPPLCAPAGGRAWLLEPGRDVRRVRLS